MQLSLWSYFNPKSTAKQQSQSDVAMNSQNSGSSPASSSQNSSQGAVVWDSSIDDASVKICLPLKMWNTARHLCNQRKDLSKKKSFDVTEDCMTDGG